MYDKIFKVPGKSTQASLRDSYFAYHSKFAWRDDVGIP